MRAKHIIYLMLLATGIACSREEETDMLPPEPVAATRSISFLSETAEVAKNYTVSAFREENQQFVFFETFTAFNREDGRLSVQLPVGRYKFLFASGYGHSIQQTPPTPTKGTTSFEEMRFTALPSATEPGKLQEGEELFLQDTRADSVYSLYTATTVRCTLERSVAQAILYIKRGRKTGENQFEALPYQQDSIIRYFSEVELQIENAGTTLDARSIPEGSAPMTAKYPATARDSITDEGFAAFTGPFFFPPKDNAPLQFQVKLHPAAGSPQPELSLTTTGEVKRNTRLYITVWVTNDWNFIGITTDTQPITAEIPGDEGIWDDTVTPL